MTGWTATSAMILTVLGIGSPTAQDRPEFTGRWTPVNPTGTSQVLRITQDATSLAVESSEGGVQERARFTFGGTVEQDVSHANIQVTSTASWNGPTLNVTTTFRRTTDGSILSIREEGWSLDQEGRLQIATTARRANGETSTTRIAYRRQ